MLSPRYGPLPCLGSVLRDHAGRTSRRNATWLILPVVICLSQRLSHACGSIPEREPEKRLPHPRKAAGRANYPNPDTGGGCGSAGPPHGEHRSARPYCRRCAPGLNCRVVPRRCYFEEIRVLKAGLRLYTLAWDNITGF
ncbi:hypothetical protein V6N13_122850 [Hibiscus sabdariffa]